MSASHKSSKKRETEAQPHKKRMILDQTLIILAGVLALGLVIRLLPLLYTIVDGRIILMGPDSYYHMRRIVYTIFHFPIPNFFDTYVNYPNGYYIGWPPLYDIISAAASLLLGLGHPDALTTEIASSMVSVLMGIAAIALTYYVVKDIISEKAALIAALLMAIMPAAVFRSLFSVVGHHELEVLGSLAIFLLFTRAVSSAKKSGMGFHGLNYPRPIIYSALAGIAIACMIFSWDGSPIFIGIIVAYALVQYAYDAFNKESSEYLTLAGAITSIVALAVVAPVIAISGLGQIYHFNPFIMSWFQVLYLVAFAAIFIITGLLSSALKKREAPWYSLPVLIFLLSASIAFAVKFALPGFFNSIENGVLYLTGVGTAMNTISEVQPLFVNGGNFSLITPWAYFSFAGIIAILGLATYIFMAKDKKADSQVVFLLVWTAIVTILCLFQTRFINLLAVNVAIFGSYFLYQALELAGLEEYLSPSAKKKPSSQRSSASRSGSMSPALMVAVVVAVLILIPVFFNTIALAFTPEPYSLDWNNACLWLKDNTPATSYAYSADPGTHPEYGVMSWWDYGNYILYEAERPAISNNFQTGINYSADFFTSPDESTANAIMDNLSGKYVMLDLRMGSTYAGVSDGIFEDMAYLAGEDPYSYHNNKTVVNGTFPPNAKYYNTMYARLFNGDGCGINVTGCDPEGLSHYKLLYTTRGDDPVKVFEYVKGANITGKASPGTTVKLQLTLDSLYGENTYYQDTKAGTDGQYTFVVPYSTSDSSFIKTGPDYTLTTGSTSSSVRVPESAVIDGATIDVT